MRFFPALERRDAAARQGPQHARPRLSLAFARPVQRRDNLRHVVAVNLDRIPAERAALLGDGLDVDHDLSIGLDAVAVDQRDEIVEAEISSRHHGFPSRTFLQFAVGEFDEHACLRSL